MTGRQGLLVYAAAFVAMLAAGAIAAIGTLGSTESIPLMWVSSALSVLAIAGAVIAVLLARR